ncbi:MAG TPA: ATP-binding protein [Terriglobales bacterium]|nr:ATP-binding protein [Terriglobales bacterium]
MASQMLSAFDGAAENVSPVEYDGEIGQHASMVQALIEAIAARKKATQELRQSEQQLRAIYDRVSDAILLFDDHSKYLDANRAACELLGCAKAEILGRTSGPFVIPECDIHDDVGKAPYTAEITGETSIHRPNGELRYIEYVASKNVLPGRHMVVVRDITERKKLELQVQKSQRMEAVGRLAAGIAHDFNNMLTVIRGYAELMAVKVGNDHPLRRYVTGITNAADRAAGITHQLLAFTRQQVLQPCVLDVNRVVQEISGILQRLIGEDVELDIRLAPDTGLIKADPAQLTQILMNLAVNARDAMPGGGKLVMETQNTELDDTYCSFHLATTPGSYVTISVTDTGCGMSPEVRSHIFEPFFTTKEQGKGTGLGLATVYGIVKQSGGDIWVYSEVGEGTTFKIYLPRVDKQHEQKRHSEVNHGNGETVVVIEDDQSARELISEYLRQRGYRVLPACDGGEALTICEQHRDEIAVVLTDVVMRGTTGQDLSGYIALRHPATKLIYMSGFPLQELVARGCVAAGESFLQKPFRLVDLAEKLAETLSSSGNPHRTKMVLATDDVPHGA